jgi:hypothetical protein
MGPIAYSFDPKTLIFSGAVKAQPCKIEVGRFYNPRFSTFKKPPEQVAGRSIYFNIGADAWEYGASPAPAVVVEKAVVEKGVEIRENLDLLKQAVANERMSLGIEMQKQLDSKSREVLDLVMSLNAKIEALEFALNGIRAVVRDNAETCNSALSIVQSIDQKTANHGDQIENVFNVLNERVDSAFSQILEVKNHVDPKGEVASGALVSSLAPQKSSWKFWT